MNKTKQIFQHEFAAMLRRKGFIVMTLIVLVLALLALGVYKVAAAGTDKAGTSVTYTGYVDMVGGFTEYVDQSGVMFIPYPSAEEATAALVENDIKEYLVIPANYLETGMIYRYTMNKHLSSSPDVASVNNFLVSNLLAEQETQGVIDRVNAPAVFITTLLDQTGEISSNQGGLGNFILLAVFAILFALSMIFSSTYMLQGLGGEKENRLMEILLSSVSTRQLLLGKVLGIASAGLIQAAVWAASVPLIFKLAENVLGSNFTALIHLPASFLLLGIAYFILGYLIFAVLATTIGAISSSVQEAQQVMGIYSMFALIPLWGMSLVIAYPDSLVWKILTIFPLSSPVLVMVRLGVSSIAPWEIILSLAVLVLCIFGGLLLSDKIFKTYLLMYGKRPSLREIMRSLKSNASA